MKRLLMLTLGLLVVVSPFACSENNPSPVKPNPVVAPTFTSTGTLPTLTFTSTATPTGTLSTPTFTPTGTVPVTSTPTPTNTFLTAPPFLSNYGTVAGPNGMYFDTGSSQLFVAEGEIRAGGIVTAFERYVVSGGGGLVGGPRGNQFVTGFPTPGMVPPWAGTTIVSSLPQGFAYGFGYFGFLDSSQNGTATLYTGCNGFDMFSVPAGNTQYPNYTTSYGGSPFLSPSAVVADSSGVFYVADTNRGYVEAFYGACGSSPPIPQSPKHRWNGPSAAATFLKPNALAVNSANHIFVGDVGYNPSVLQEYSSGGTTLLGNWTLTANCAINGLAVDNAGNVYVSDTQNGGQVEHYLITPYPTTPTSTLNLVRKWGDPFGPHEFLPFLPSCIILDSVNNQIIVGDTNNDLIQIFGP